MNKKKELLWFLIPFSILFVVEFSYLFEEAFQLQLNVHFVDWSMLLQAESRRLVFSYLLRHYGNCLLNAALYGGVIGGLLWLLRRRCSFGRDWFYGILFTAVALCQMVFSLVQLEAYWWWGLFVVRFWLDSLFVASCAALAAQLIEAVITFWKEKGVE